MTESKGSEGLFWRLDREGTKFTERGSKVKPTDGPAGRAATRRAAKDKKKGTKSKTVPFIEIRSSLPEIPHTDWTLPTEFPDLSAARRIAIDVETYDPDLKELGPGVRRDGYMVGLAVAVDGWKAYYPFAHKGTSLNLDKKKVLSWAKKELSRKSQPKLGTNLGYDTDYLAEEGVNVQGPLWDLTVAEPLLDENAYSYSLDRLAKKYLGESKQTSLLDQWGDQAFGAGGAAANIYQSPPELVGLRAEGDVTQPLRIFPKQLKALVSEGLEDLFSLESRLVPLMVGMRRRGVRVDLSGSEQLGETLKKTKAVALKEVHRLSGYDIGNDLWTQDGLVALFSKLGITPPRTGASDKHPDGQPSFRKKWLASQHHEAVKQLLIARTADRFDGTFIQGHIGSHVIKGRLHCLFHQLPTGENGAVSGRFSSSDPNLQNIPTRDKIFGPLIRALFLPDEGELWGARDWSQVEYRLLVHFAAVMGLTGVQSAVDAYINDRETDFHKYVAKLTGLERGDAKNFNFGMVYGQGIKLIAATLGISLTAAQQLADVYHSNAPYIRELARACTARADKKGYIRTLLNRRRRFDKWEDRNASRDNRVLYDEGGVGRKRAFTHAALNAVIQGSAADVMKKAMVDIYESGICDVLGFPLLTVHDELAFSVPKTKAGREAMKEAHRIMETCVELRIPLLADGGEGANWHLAKAA